MGVYFGVPLFGETTTKFFCETKEGFFVMIFGECV